MDAVVFITVSLVMFGLQVFGKTGSVSETEEMVVEDITREVRLNETFYEDPDAFSEISHALGF